MMRKLSAWRTKTILQNPPSVRHVGLNDISSLMRNAITVPVARWRTLLRLCSSKLELEVSVPSLTLIVMKRKPEAVRFRIVFPKADAKTDKNFFEIDTAAKLRYLNLGPYVAEAFGLSPYQDIHLKIRSCLTRKDMKVDVCGNFSDFKMLSNVAGSSREIEISRTNDR